MNSNITPFLLILLSAGLFYVYVNPQYAEIQQLNAKETEYASALEKAQQIQEIRSTLLAKYNNFSPENLAKLETLLPDDVDSVRVALDISGMAKKYNIAIENIRVDKPLDVQQNDETGQTKAYGEAKVTFVFTTSFDNFSKFVQDIEQSLRIVDVSGITFRPQTNGSFNYSLTVNTYWLK